MRVRFGPFEFDEHDGLWCGAREVRLPPRALAVLAALVRQPGRVVSKQSLLETCWRDTFVTEASLLEAVRLLRQALGDDRLNPTYLQTVHRRGYRFVAEVTIVTDREDVPNRELESVSPQGANAVPDERTPAPRPVDSIFSSLDPWRPLIAFGASAVAVTMAVAFVFALFGQRAPEPRPALPLTITLPEDRAIDPLQGSIAVSLDGTRMVYVAATRRGPQLFLRTIERDELRAIPGTAGAADPFFSPDGEWIGFFAHASLKKVRVTGGPPITLCAARIGAGATWLHDDDTIIFGGAPGGGLARVSARGGEPVVLAAPAPGSRELTFGWPDVLPDRRSVVFTITSVADTSVALLDLVTGRRHTLIDRAAFARYAPTGHLVFERHGRIEAVPFSPGESVAARHTRPVVFDLASGASSSAGPRFAFSRTGSLVYVPGAADEADAGLHWLDTSGRLEALAAPVRPAGSVDVTPDLQQVALTVKADAQQDVWVGDLARGAWKRLPAAGQSVSPTWRPDGLAIAFAYSKAGPFNLFVRPPDSAAPPHALTDSPWNQVPTSWSTDGRLLAFTEYHPFTGADVWLLDLVTLERRPAVRSPFHESHARFSPDGRWLAYMSNESGRWEVIVRRTDGSGSRIQLSTSGGAYPCWSIDGRTIYFNAGGRTAAVAVQPSPELRASEPIVISTRDDLEIASGRADLDRVLVRGSRSMSVRRELRVVLEWFSVLTRHVRRPV